MVDMKLYNYRMIELALENPEASVAHQASHTMQNPARSTLFFSGQKAAQDSKPGVFSGMKNIFSKATRALTGKQSKHLFESEGSAIRRELSKRSVADAPGVMPLEVARTKGAKDGEQGENAAWESVLLARNVHRPTAKYYICLLYTSRCV